MRSILANYETANFSELLGLLLEHRVPYPSALVLAAESTGDARLTRGARQLAEAIARGESAAAALGQIDRGTFLPMMRWVLATGQEQGSLVAALHNLADVYRKRGSVSGRQAVGVLAHDPDDRDRRERDLVLWARALHTADQHAAGTGGAVKKRSDSIGGQNGAGGRLSGAETAELSRQIAGLATAGLPLAHGLVALGEELPRGRLRRSMNELAATLESGVTLDEALDKQRDRIPPHLRGLVIAGLRSGRLGDILSRFSEYVAIGTELERRLWLSLAYPILTVGTALALFFFVCVILVGQFEAIYKDFNIPLPRMTIALIAIARVREHGLGPGG